MIKNRNSLGLKPQTSSSNRLPVINGNKTVEVLFQRNQNGTKDERFNAYFQHKYQNSRNIMDDFQKTLSNYSFLGLRLSEKPNISLKLPVENTEIFLDNYIGHKHNKKPNSSQSNRSRCKTSQERFRTKKILPPSFENEIDYRACYERVLSNLFEFVENFERLSQIFNILKNPQQKNNTNLNIFNDYWEFIHNLGLERLLTVFLEKENHNILKKTVIYEIIYMALTHYFVLLESKEEYSEIQFFWIQIKKIFHFIHQNYLLQLSMTYHIIKHIPKTVKMPDFQNMQEIISKRLMVSSLDDTIRGLKYNNKTLENYNKEFFHSLLLSRTKLLQKTELFNIFEYFLSTDTENIDVSDLKIQIIKSLIKILKPAGFFQEKDQMKEIFLTGTFATLNIENIDFEVSAQKNLEPPLLPPIKNYQYSLVLELEGVLLISYLNEENDVCFKKRPGVDKFLKEMSKFYEITIYTIASQEFLDKSINIFDDTETIKYRLNKDHNVKIKNQLVKDLNLLGRDLKRTIYVDWNVENFQLQPENGIFIKKWDGNGGDECLKNLEGLLTHFAIKKFNDLRSALVNYRDQAVRLLWNGVKVELV